MGRTYLIDVRSSADYRTGYLPGSVNLPLDEVEGIAGIAPDYGAEILLYCETGKHSRCVRTVLMYMGYDDVKNLGSMEDAAAFLDTVKPVCHNPRDNGP
jgi:phage shock protein E